MKGIGWAVQAMLGKNSAVVSGLGASAQQSPNMNVTIAEGQVYQWAAADSTSLGSLASDSTQILQQGHVDSQTLALNVSQLTGTQQQYALIQATFEQLDQIRSGDPTGGQIAFYNSSNPPVPLQGPDGLGGTLNTIRRGYCNINVVYGTPAAAGSAVPPNPSTGYVPLYLILLSANQTEITQGEIQTAGPSVYAGYQHAPFLAGLLGQHHLGIDGTAPQIDVTKEITGVVPYANLPVSNPTPPSVGTNIVASPGIPITVYGNVNPNGNVAGQVGDQYFWEGQGAKFECTTAGAAGVAVWSQVGSGGQVIDVTTWVTAYTPAVGNNTYLCHTTGATNPTVDLLLSTSMSNTKHVYKNVGTVTLTLHPQASDSIEGGSAGADFLLQPGDSVCLAPSTSSGGYYAV